MQIFANSLTSILCIRVYCRSASYYNGAETSNAILDEYFRYKNTSTPYLLTEHSVHVPPPPAAAEPFISTVKPRSFYSRAGSSAIDDYDEADMNSFLAQRNARRPLLAPGRRIGLDYSLDPRRRSASSLDAIPAQPRPYSTGKGPAGIDGGYRPSQSLGILPASAYTGRWYPTSSVSRSSGRGFNPSAALGAMTSYDVHDDVSVYCPISGHGMRSAGRTIATRVTPAPGYGPCSAYARSHSLSRY